MINPTKNHDDSKRSITPSTYSATQIPRSDLQPIKTFSDSGSIEKLQISTPVTPTPTSIEESKGKRTPRWFNYVERRLNTIALESVDELDGYPLPPPDTIQRARDFAFSYLPEQTPTPSVVPSNDAGIEFIWYKGGWQIEVSFTEEGSFTWARNLHDVELWSGPLENYLPRLLQQLELLSLQD